MKNATIWLTVTLLIAAGGRVSAAAPLSLEKQGEDVFLVWRVPKCTVWMRPPTFVVSEGAHTVPLSVKIRLASQKCVGGRAECEYVLAIDHDGTTRTGKYRIAWSMAKEDKRVILRQTTGLHFDRPLQLDVTVTGGINLPAKQARRCTLPLRNGIVKGFEVDTSHNVAAFFILGRGATVCEGQQLAMPVIGLGGGDSPGGTLAVAVDPYCGAQFHVTGGQESAVTMSTTYKGSLVPIGDERRTRVMAFHTGGIDGTLSVFYETIPEIEPGAAWIHDIQLNYYDYLGDGGQGWFDDLKKLAEKIPPAQRKHVVVCLHGWYDYLGRYCFDQKIGKLADEWIAFPRTRKTAMSKTDMHKRIRFAKGLGFRTLLYFADGLNSDSTMPDYPKDWLFEDERGKGRGGWTGPSTGKTYTLDSSNPEVRQFLLDYADALLNEYGREIDGLVWDETFYIEQERLASGPDGLAYADRDFMTLVAELTRKIQARRKSNPRLVFLTSDLLLPRRPYAPYALVSHGTYQDTTMNPQGWPLGLLPNYRNCLWSCNWFPMRHGERNRIAPEVYGLPQGLSNGYGDNVGPAKMPAGRLDEVIQRFFKRLEEGGRTRYLTEPTAHVVETIAACTTRQDAAGGCDGLKTGTWGFCTSCEPNPWWQVDLGQPAALDRVVIYNRCDNKMEVRTRRLKVLLSADGNKWTEAYQHNGSSFFGYTDDKPLSVSLKGARARLVRIQLPGTDYLHLDEVEVYAPASKKNLALGKQSDQSSVSPWSTPGPAKTKLPPKASAHPLKP
jgi:hypothetical protein